MHDKIKYIPDKVVLIMVDRREYLPFGTTLQLETGNIYEITGAPVGYGGGSILYPARRLVTINDKVQSDGFSYVLKECFPVSGYYNFVRSESGEIVPQSNTSESKLYLDRAKKLLLKEETVSHAIYQTASRVMPIRESAAQVVLRLPGKAATSISNTVTVMESLTEKGNSITTWIKDNKRFSPFQTFRIIQQLLFALREVHQAGYLHLDIQDGNIFLKGTLEQKDELVTLIDFGSARPMVDGKTAPIQDQVIFTTPGFAAPEIMLNNDGTLQLGAETDIYSVGCLALYLLTGRKPDTRALLENRTGLYLKPNQLRRIKCPKHLVDRMQQILATALDRSIGKRYHSVDEMLQDVADFVEALQPYRTDLSAVKYDAFICYKHGPIDCEAAVTLQRELENYRAPKGVSNTRKIFKRVFVDEGELSSCADFGQQIREALQNSGWLIVVCSEDTPTSPWVQLEIDTFLETHSRSRVLCVMTGGDEKVSFPPQLKGNQADEGEVLAADARGSDIREVKKKLRKDALLKIAAPMMGITFDSLKQRHKLYQMQRFAAMTAGVLAVAVGFAAYAVNRANVIAEQAVRIEQEYENALINESLFLAEQAQKRLDDNDPLGAMELALKALPSEEQDRPVLTEAEYVLGEALGIYTTPSSAINTASVTDVINTDLSDFFLTKDGKYLVCWGQDKNVVRIVDTKKTEIVRSIELESDPIRLSSQFLLADNALIIPTEGKLTCVNYLTGNVYWTSYIDGRFSLCVSDDESKLVVLSCDKFSSDDSATQTISVFSSSTGVLQQKFLCTILEEEYASSDIYLSPDMKWLAIKAYFSSNKYALYLVDLETGASRQLTEMDARVDSVQFLGSGISVIRSSGHSFLLGNSNYRSFFMDPITVWLEFYDLESGDLVWRSAQCCYDVCEEGGILTSVLVQYPVSEEPKNGILYTFFNKSVLLDYQTGATVNVFEMSSSVVDILYQDNKVITINADGTYHNVNLLTGRILQIKTFDESIISLCRYGSTFYIRYGIMFEEDPRILKYELAKYDDSYTQLGEIGDTSSWDQFDLYDFQPILGGVKVVLAQKNQVCFVDTLNGTTKIYDISEKYGFDKYYILGVSDDFSTLYWECHDWENEHLWINHSRFYSLDLFSGEIVLLKMPEKPGHLDYRRIEDIAFYDEKLFFIVTERAADEQFVVLYCWNFVDGSLTELYRKPLCVEIDMATKIQRCEDYIASSLGIDENTQELQFAIGLSIDYFDESGWSTQSVYEIPQQLIRIEIHEGTAKTTNLTFDLDFELGHEDSYFLWLDGAYRWDTTGNVAVFGFNNYIYAVDTDGKMLWKRPVENRLSDIGFSQNSSSLCMLSDEGIFSSYCISDGSLQTAMYLADYSGNSSPTTRHGAYWEYIDDTTLLMHFSNCSIVFDISDSGFKKKAVVDECIGYDPQNDCFFVLSDSHLIDSTVIGSFPRYSLDDLIQKASDIMS